MKILIAEDDEISRKTLGDLLSKSDYDVVSASDGKEAMEIINKFDDIKIAIFDVLMPEIDGITLCKKIRKDYQSNRLYIIMLTVKNTSSNIIDGLQAGADDYVCKPYDVDELKARISVGKRVIELEEKLKQRILELTKAIFTIKKLEGFLQICSYCKKIRKDPLNWEALEQYISERSNAVFSHGICPDCYDKIFKEKFGSLE